MLSRCCETKFDGFSLTWEGEAHPAKATARSKQTLLDARRVFGLACSRRRFYNEDKRNTRAETATPGRGRSAGRGEGNRFFGKGTTMKGSTSLILAGTMLLCGSVHAASVSWIDGMGAVAPSTWSISPSNPSTTDVISFSGPTDRTYGNSCQAEATFGGTPYLSVNNSTKTIELKFQGPPPSTCILIYKPAVGFRGDFGPLAAGNWTFKCTQSLIPFQINFTVGGGGGGHVIRVDRNVPLVIWTPDGSSWTRAYPNLQDGLAAATAGDTLHVADGTYVPDDGSGVTPGDRTASFDIPTA